MQRATSHTHGVTRSAAVRFIRILPAALIVLCALAASSSPLWAQTLTVQIIDPPTDPYMFFAGDEQSFEAVAYVDGVELDDGAVTWNWDFGDATDPSTANPTTHTYQDAGTFLVTVTATYGNLQGQATVNANVASIVGPGGQGDARAVLSVNGANGGEVDDSVTLWITLPNGAQGSILQTASQVGNGAWTMEQGQGVWSWDATNHRWTRYMSTTDHQNHVPWSWQVQVQLPGMSGEVIWTNTMTMYPYNTVVTSGTDVILHHAGDTQHQINWNIAHKPETGICGSWEVTVTITDMSGGTVKVLSTTQTGAGAGSATWDGTGTMGQQAPTGVYAYTVSAMHPMCIDQDKSRLLTATINDDKFYYVAKNAQTGKLTVIVRYSLNYDAKDCTIRFYGPDLTELGELSGRTATAGTHWSGQKDISAVDANGNILAPLYCVIWATESATMAAAIDRDPNSPKQAPQRGAAQLEAIGIISPAEGAKFAYEGDSQPETCAVPALASPYGVTCNWSITPISGAELTTWPFPPDGGPQIQFDYVGLPISNGEFGSKTISLAMSELNLQFTRTVKVFFNKYGHGHPGKGFGILTAPGHEGEGLPAPNWYYYWTQTSADFGTHWYHDSVGSRCAFILGMWRVEIGNLAAAGPHPIYGWGNPMGIDLFAWTCRHEGEHLADMTAWWGLTTNRNDTDDPDHDFMPTSVEIANGYDPHRRCSVSDVWGYGRGFNDSEDYCLSHQQHWLNGAADAGDWASPGHQWGEQ